MFSIKIIPLSPLQTIHIQMVSLSTTKLVQVKLFDIFVMKVNYIWCNINKSEKEKKNLGKHFVAEWTKE